MNINGEITLGNLLTAASVLVSAAALAYGWRNDRQLRRMEYADRVRRAAGITASVFDRWQALTQQFFDGIQPLILEVDALAGTGQELVARHALIRGIYEQRAMVARRIAEERIETAYVDLYGYDPRTHALFLSTIERLRQIDNRAFERLLDLARGNPRTSVVAAGDSTAEGESDLLRRHCDALFRAHQEDAGSIIRAFHAQMLRLIQASDGEILGRRVELNAAAEALPAAGRAAGDGIIR